MDNAPATILEIWRGLMKRLGTGSRKALPFISGVTAALMGLILFNWMFPDPLPLTTREVEETIAQAMASATPPPAFSQEVYQLIQPSLVLIETIAFNDEGEEDGGLGSGVIIDFTGHILTSLHVVEGAAEIILTFADGTRMAGELVIVQPENDIAVVRTIDPPPPFPPAIMGNPNALRVGDEAYAVGNPFGLYSSMSAGVISGLERTFILPDSEQRLEGLMQIDAAVNPGNSGGPLLNRDGYVVGIVTGLVNPTEENFFVGIAFAVPIDVAVAAVGSPPH